MTWTTPLAPAEPGFHFGGECFDLDVDTDREILRFMLSQALYREARGVACGQALHTAPSLDVARFYIRHARQELHHLVLLADVFRELGLQPQRPHWVTRLLIFHSQCYPLKVLLEHTIGARMVHDIVRDVLIQTLSESDPRVVGIREKLGELCRSEAQHLAWGERETRRMLERHPWLRTPYAGLIELQLCVIGWVARGLLKKGAAHPVLARVPAFAQHIRAGLRAQGRELGILEPAPVGRLTRGWAMLCGGLFYLRGRGARSRSRLHTRYLHELGFEG